MKKEKLLILGISTDTRDAIAYAQSLGIYVVLTDYNPVDSHPVKKLADECWQIDLKDTEALKAKMVEEGIDYIYGAANNEFCIDQALKIASEMGLPYYVSQESWAVARDKELFKEKCLEAGLKLPLTYKVDYSFSEEFLDSVHYPVIVKPADSNAQQGLSICYEKKDLKKACEFALSFSKKKRVVVEEYMRGQELTIPFYVHDGEPHCIGFHHTVEGEINGRQNFVFFQPDDELAKDFLETCQSKIRKLFAAVGYQEGPCFIQGFYTEGEYKWMEMALRLSGPSAWNHTEKCSGVHTLKSMIDLCINRKPVVPKKWKPVWTYAPETAYFIWCKPGKICSETGIEEVYNNPNLTVVTHRYHAGDTVKMSDNMYQIALIIRVSGNTVDEVEALVAEINEKVHMYNEDGEDLLFHFDYQR